MISIKNLNKYFYKNKKNQIHIINDTSLEFGKTGLVALLGPSGCGKTTLLNAIGGLDKVNSGEIYINGKRITKTFTSKKDEIRNLNIGYIFQNYYLIDDMSVFDNVALVLKMIGIKDKNIIKNRVNYILETLGIYKYRHRPTNTLSGGERQRVGIARAIAKNPNIIIADEPTGNLDSKNTIEIMNIIKTISKDKLVILVTHEKDIAYFYADRIIELKDGKVISDKENIHDDSLDYYMEDKIYLKDIKYHELFKNNHLKLNYYFENEEDIDINIVVKNGNIYVETSSNNKIEVVDDNSSIQLIDDTYKKITKDSYEKYNFNYMNFLDENIKLKYSSIYNIVSLLKNGFKKIKSYSILKKILLSGFLISSMFVLYSISNLAGIMDIKDEEFITRNKNYLSVQNINKDSYFDYEKENSINYILIGDSKVTFRLKYDFFYQTYNAKDSLTGSLSSINMIKKDDLIYGRMPNNEYEIVVDKLCIDRMFKKYTAKQVGIINVSDVLNLNAYISNVLEFKIVGITDLKSPSIYTDESMFINIISNNQNITDDLYGYDMIIEEDTNKIVDYNLVSNEIKLKKGRMPTNDYEIIVNNNNSYMYELNKEINIKVNNNKLKVVGYYESSSYQYMLSNLNTVKYKLLDTYENITIYPNDKEKVIDYFNEKSIEIKDVYKEDKEDYINKNKDQMISSIVISGIMLVISLVEIYLIVRASFLSRIKEVGILRAIGVKKKDIYKMFLGEILAITLTASLFGVIFMGYILSSIVKLPLINDNYLFNPLIVIICLIIIFSFNILVGLLPVFNTIRKTPAQILSRTDID